MTVQTRNIDDHSFRVPLVLRGDPASVKRVLLIGSCLMNEWASYIKILDDAVVVDTVTYNGASVLPEMTQDRAAEYDMQILQIPLRSVLPESLYFSIRANDVDSYTAAFEAARERLLQYFRLIIDYNSKFNLTTFVMNFFTPQQNPLGRLQPRYCLSNLVYFIEELNRELFGMISLQSNCFMLDADQILASFGKKQFLDDSLYTISHGSHLYNAEFPASADQERLEPIGDVLKIFSPITTEVISAIYLEAVAGFSSLNQRDSIKLVIFDLDDTLWRGVAADGDENALLMKEGWPLGILEAASYLWRRGVLLAIVSKNDEENAVRIWNVVYGREFDINKFALRKINWKPKPDNIEEILISFNILPQNVLYVDDNPLERAAVKLAFPEIRLLEGPLIHWRRALLWSAETQTAVITDESTRRTDMIQTNILRDERRSGMSRVDFLQTLGLEITVSDIRGIQDPGYARCFELINKTNQFNTTGKRWTSPEMSELFLNEGYIIAFSIADKYTDYGLTAAMIITGNVIGQFVLSCRVFGLDVEFACVKVAVDRILSHQRHSNARAKLQQTEKNKLCLSIYKDLEFVEVEGGWETGLDNKICLPAHILIL